MKSWPEPIQWRSMASEIRAAGVTAVFQARSKSSTLREGPCGRAIARFESFLEALIEVACRQMDRGGSAAEAVRRCGLLSDECKAESGLDQSGLLRCRLEIESPAGILRPVVPTLRRKIGHGTYNYEPRSCGGSFGLPDSMMRPASCIRHPASINALPSTRTPKHWRSQDQTVVSPSRACSTALRVRASVSPSSNCNANRVALLRLPTGRPAGFPEAPLANGLPRTLFLFLAMSVSTRPSFARWGPVLLAAGQDP